MMVEYACWNWLVMLSDEEEELLREVLSGPASRWRTNRVWGESEGGLAVSLGGQRGIWISGSGVSGLSDHFIKERWVACAVPPAPPLTRRTDEPGTARREARAGGGRASKSSRDLVQERVPGRTVAQTYWTRLTALPTGTLWWRMAPVNYNSGEKVLIYKIYDSDSLNNSFSPCKCHFIRLLQ